MRKTLTIIIALCIILACNPFPAKDNSKILRADLTKKNKISIHDLFQKMDLIQLETNDNSLLTGISKVDCFEHKLYIYDNNLHNILLFTDTGKFLGKVGRSGNGPGEYMNITAFNLNKSTKQLSLLSNFGTISNYDLHGNFLNKFQLSNERFICHAFCFLNNDSIIVWNHFGERDKQFSLYSIKFNKILKNVVTRKTDIYDFINDIFNEYDGHIFYSQSLDPKVYRFNNKGELEFSHQWDFGTPGLKFVEGNGDEREKKMKILAMFENSQIPFVITIQRQNCKYYYARVVFNKKDYVHVIVDRKSGKSFVFNEFSEGITFHPLYWADDFVIGMAEAYKKHVIIPSMLNKSDKVKFESIKEMDNPCLIKYYFNN